MVKISPALSLLSRQSGKHCKKDRRKAPLLYRQQMANLRRYSGACPGGDFTLKASVTAARRPAKGGHRMVPFPLDSPKPSFALTHRRCATKTGGNGARFQASVRFFGTLSGPEVSLREPPRITVRGQTVQGGSVPLRKAPLRSRVVPWSTKRPCGPLAF